MKFICSYEKIKSELEIALPFTQPRNSLNQTLNVYLETSNNQLTIKATDNKSGYINTIPVETITPGSTSIFCEKLVEVLKFMTSSDQLIFSEENGKFVIEPADKNVSINISLKSMEASSFPELLSVNDSLFFNLPLADFTNMVDKTSFAISSDPVRVFLTGVYFKKKGDSSVSMVATDGRKLAYIEKNMEKEIPDFPSAIIPDKFFKNLKLISNDNSSVFSLAVTNSHIFARVGSRFMYTALINGNYPNYQKVIPSKFNYSFIVKTKEFENSLSLNSVLIDSKSRRIFIDVASEGVMITGDSNEYGESKQLIKCEYDGPEIKISFNSGIIAPAVKKVDGEFMRVSFNSATQAVKLSPDPEKDYLFVVMPLQS